MRLRILGLALILTAPLTAEAQQVGRVYRVGILTSTFDELGLSVGLPPRLQELDYVEGANVRYEKESAGGADERLPELAVNLARLKVDVIVTSGSSATRAAKQGAITTPIVMATEDDPVGAGLVATLARPGGNITGFTVLSPILSVKRLELLKETVPRLTRVGVLWSAGNRDKAAELMHVRAAAQALRIDVVSLEVRAPEDLPQVFETASKQRCQGLLVLSDNRIWPSRATVVALAAKHRLPTVYPNRLFLAHFGAEAVGLMSYEADRFEMLSRIAAYVDRILKGAKPADLPVEQPTKFELVVNLKAAKALGLTIPPSILVRADRVIE